MNALSRACLITAIVWECMHFWHGVMFADRHAVRALNVVAILVCALAFWRACAPLATGDLRFRRAEAPVVTVMSVAVVALVMPFLTPLGVQSYANWTLGAVAPVIAALVMRRRLGCAVALSAAACALVILTVIWRGLAPSWAVSLCFAPLLWLGAAVLVRRVFDRTEAVVGGYGAAEREADQQAAFTAARKAVADARRAELRLEVVPLLQRIDTEGPLSDETRAQCRLSAARLRDGLRARVILTPELDQLLMQARRAGTRFDVLDDRDVPADDLATRRARDVIAAAVTHLRQAEAVYRISADGSSSTLVIRGPADVLAQTHGALRTRLNLSCTVDSGVLFVRCH